jgi:hypothetical protein
MARTAADIIKRAREQHVLFDPFSHSDPILLRQLTEIRNRLRSRAMRIEPSILTLEDGPTALPLASYASGYTVPAFDRILRGRIWTVSPGTPETEYPLHFVEAHQRHAPPAWPSMWERNGALYQTGIETDWAHYAEFTIDYIAAATDLAAVTDPIGLPDKAEGALFYGLAAFMASRTDEVPEGVKPPDPAELENKASRSEGDWLDELEIRRVTVATVPEVW